MSAMQRNKGAAGERELCAALSDLLGIEVKRNLQQARDGGHDLLGLHGWAIECKRAAHTKLIRSWWKQAVEQAGDRYKPALAYRLDRQPWRVRVAMCDVFDAFAGQPRCVEFTAEFGLEGYAAIVREQMALKNV